MICLDDSVNPPAGPNMEIWACPQRYAPEDQRHPSAGTEMYWRTGALLHIIQIT